MRKKRKAKTQALVPRKPASALNDALQPTPEMQSRVEFEYGPVKTEMNIQIGSAYRRRPLYQTMASKDGRFTADEVSAMTLYRSVFDRCERSPFASCLASEQGGGRGLGPASFIHASPAIVEAKRKLALLESALGATLSTMRDVVLQDKPFTTIAMERFGFRARNWILVSEPVLNAGEPAMLDGKPILRAVHREEMVPRSGRDRERVAAEFNAGIKLLADASRRLAGADIDELWVQPRADGTAVIHRASIAPNELYRLWGPTSLVARVLDDLIDKHGEKAVFPSPGEARAALVEADDNRLYRLDPDELAQ